MTGLCCSPKSLAVIIKTSRELWEDSINISQMLDQSLRNSFAVEVDRVALTGGGSNEPTGIGATNEINLLPSGPISDYDPIVEAMALH